MKTQSSAKMLACLLMLFAVPAVATVVNITSDQTDYTFASGTTYYVSANITLHGTTTFESGAVLKYNGSGQINIPSDGTVVCPSGAESATFTSYNDNSVGETVSGSSGTPAISDVNTFLNVNNVTLSNMRFYYGQSPLSGSGDMSACQASLQNCEFFYADSLYVQSAQIFNNLFVGVNDFDWLPSADNSLVQNNTFVNSGVILDYGYFTPVVVSDNLFDSGSVSDWTTYGSTGGNNAFYNETDYLGPYASGLPTDKTYSGEPDYLIGPLGSYYLPSGSPLIDGGDVPASDAGLDAFTTQINQMPDSGTVDIGYHYPIASQNYIILNSNQTNFTFSCGITYFIDANITLHGTTTFESGTVLKYNSSGQINIPSDGTIICPSGAEPATFTSYNDNSVGETVSGSSGTPATSDVNTFLNVNNVTLSNLHFYYGEWPLSGTGNLSSAIVTLQNCEFFYADSLYVQTSQVFDNLFVGTYLDLIPGADPTVVQNNTLVSSSVAFDALGSTAAVVVSDNLFDSTEVLDWSNDGTSGGNNAFYNCSDWLDWGNGLPTDITLTSAPNYQAGPLGNYYLPSDSPLIDAGDMPATDAGLDAFTTQTSQTPDSGTVDIGYHYQVISTVNSSLGTNFWLMFYSTAVNGAVDGVIPTLSLNITSSRGATVTVTTLLPVVWVTNAGNTALNGTYVLTNLNAEELEDWQANGLSVTGPNYTCGGTNWINPSPSYIGDHNVYSLLTYDSTTHSLQFMDDAYGTDLNIDSYPSDYSGWYSYDSYAPPQTVCPQIPVTNTFTVGPGQVTNITIFTEMMFSADSQVASNSIHVTANAPVSVYGLNYGPEYSAAFTVYPTPMLGTNYYLMGYGGPVYGIAAAQNNTHITIQSSSGPVTVTLQQGQTYQAEMSSDLTGTQLTSDKPVAVFAGSYMNEVPANVNWLQPLIQQQTPVEDWGTNVLSLGFATRAYGDTYRVLAAFNDTTVTITSAGGTTTAPLNAGQFTELILDGPAEFQANHPIQVAHFSNGEGYDQADDPSDNGDPAEILLQPVGHYLQTNVVVTFTNDLPYQIVGDFRTNFLNLFVPQTATNSTYVDSSLVNVANYIPIGTSGYYGARITITNSGAHTVSSSQPVGVEVYGFGFHDAYGYFGSFVK